METINIDNLLSGEALKLFYNDGIKANIYFDAIVVPRGIAEKVKPVNLEWFLRDNFSLFEIGMTSEIKFDECRDFFSYAPYTSFMTNEKKDEFVAIKIFKKRGTGQMRLGILGESWEEYEIKEEETRWKE